MRVNTLSGQLARARRRLLDRLGRRGVAPAVLVGTAASPPAVAAQAVGWAGGSLPPGHILELAQEAMTMGLVKVKLAAVVVLACGLAAGLNGEPPKAAPKAANPLVADAPAAPGAGPSPAKTVLATWGTVNDPDGDCKFSVSKGRLSIGIPGKDHALGVERGQMNAPRVLRDVEGDFIAQVRVSGEFLQGAESVVANRRPFHGAGLLLWHDDKNYIRLERAELVSEKTNMRYASFEQRRNGEFVRVGNAATLPLTEKETYLRLERRNGKVYGAASADGVEWSSLQPIAVELPRSVRIGVAAGHNTSSRFDPTFDEFKLFVEQGTADLNGFPKSLPQPAQAASP
ncbi:hypothetical protein FTUN_7503 [Frigoriglobus tundricola]|uniref:Beta-xylosidase C-terminal Concanavalin A-like domain-containing protein n=1 Tax=Frigoriglobus tundricola TaxID=2774151 RepID=A0A6M5Z2V5_9BACT|nr:hypothetical protein FTUN_7503 [Frigoriglobus tundricola]